MSIRKIFLIRSLAFGPRVDGSEFKVGTVFGYMEYPEEIYVTTEVSERSFKSRYISGPGRKNRGRNYIWYRARGDFAEVERSCYLHVV